MTVCLQSDVLDNVSSESYNPLICLPANRKALLTMDSSQNLTKTGGQEVVVVLATRAGLVIFGLAIQSLLAYALLPEGRGAYAVCVMFGSLLAVLFIPGAERGTQYFVMAKKISVSQGISFATAICLVGSFLGISLSIPLIHSDISFFQKAETRSFYLSLTLVPLSAFSSVMQFQLAGLRRFGKLFFFLLLQSLTNLIGVFSLGLDIGSWCRRCHLVTRRWSPCIDHHLSLGLETKLRLGFRDPPTF